MNSKFDELTRSVAQSGTRRGALKKFGVGLAGMTLACFGLAPKASGGDCKKLGSPMQQSLPVLQWFLQRPLRCKKGTLRLTDLSDFALNP